MCVVAVKKKLIRQKFYNFLKNFYPNILCPRQHTFIVKNLPKNLNGKIDRSKIRKVYEKKFDYSKLNKIFEENWSSLSESKKLNSLQNWDSLKQIELVILIEKKIKKKTLCKRNFKI